MFDGAALGDLNHRRFQIGHANLPRRSVRSKRSLFDKSDGSLVSLLKRQVPDLVLRFTKPRPKDGQVVEVPLDNFSQEAQEVSIMLPLRESTPKAKL